MSRPPHESRTNRERRKLSYDAWLKSVKEGGLEGNIQFVKADVEDAVEHDDDLADFWAFSVASGLFFCFLLSGCSWCRLMASLRSQRSGLWAQQDLSELVRSSCPQGGYTCNRNVLTAASSTTQWQLMVE